MRLPKRALGIFCPADMNLAGLYGPPCAFALVGTEGTRHTRGEVNLDHGGIWLCGSDEPEWFDLDVVRPPCRGISARRPHAHPPSPRVGCRLAPELPASGVSTPNTASKRQRRQKASRSCRISAACGGAIFVRLASIPSLIWTAFCDVRRRLICSLSTRRSPGTRPASGRRPLRG